MHLINPYRFSEDLPLGNIISSWQFESDSTDGTGSNDGSDTSMSYVSGLVGNCASFNTSTSSNIEIADDDTLSFGNGSTDSPFSVTFMRNFDTVTTQVWFFSKRDLGTGQEYQCVKFSSYIQFYLFNGGGSSAYLAIRTSVTESTTTGVWEHFGFTYDGSGNVSGMKIYIDGVEQSVTDISVGSYTAMSNTSQPVVLGKADWSTGLSLFGKMDECFLWDIELSADQMSNLSTQQLAGTDILA